MTDAVSAGHLRAFRGTVSISLLFSFTINMGYYDE
jgi:hypothetical protein